MKNTILHLNLINVFLELIPKMNRFRKLLVRFEKTDAAYLGLIKLACAFIAFRKIKII
ncbi:hypothetical protein [Clostridium sp.]|uniref:hypothetical protein n=1 Tax=Clostridium sp. TaxID=1506 RepID=UPI003FA5A80F